MALYNLTWIANSSGYAQFIQRVNSELMFGWLGPGLLLTICIILFLSFLQSTGDVKKSMAGTSFIAFILSLMLKTFYIVPTLAVWVSLILLAVSVVLTFKE